MTAPLVLFAYKRPDHLAAILNALRDNPLAARTPLHVFSDGPKTEADAPGVAAVRRLLRNLPGFASVEVVEREANRGLAASVISGVTEILGRYGRAIVLEDDILTSPGFLTYMNAALDHYRDDPGVMSVTGYTFPERGMKLPAGYPYDAYSHYRCASWSWGTWADRWSLVDWDLACYETLLDDESLQAAFSRGGPDMMATVSQLLRGKIDAWAIRFCYAHARHDMRCIYPVKSLVNNIGLDNSGTHCTPDPRRQHARLDPNWLPRRFCPADPVNPVIDERFRAVFGPEPASLLVRALGKARRLAGRVLHRSRSLAGAVRRRVYPGRQSLEVLMVNALQRDGGAARAAWRTFNAVQSVFPDSRYLTLLKEDVDPRVTGVRERSATALAVRAGIRLERQMLRRYPRRQPNLFSPALWPNPLRTPLRRFRPELLHLHWVAYGLLDVAELARMDCPVVWTLHDAWAFTGGCHYTGECQEFTRECGRCPQLGSQGENDFSRRLFRRKAQAYDDLDITVVTPSRWLAEMAGHSSLFKGRRIEVIPNGLDLNVYRPLDHEAAKRYLDLPQGVPVFLFGAQHLNDPRKGGDMLAQAFRHIDFPCVLMTFGAGPLPALPKHVTLRSMGSLADDMSLALLYSAADVFLCASREDNLPNTVVEALACGTPCVAFDINGLPDLIEPGETGWLARPFDPKDFAEGMRALSVLSQSQDMRDRARLKAESEYGLDLMCERYISLYKDILGGNLGRFSQLESGHDLAKIVRC